MGKIEQNIKEMLVVVRGGGDLATGVVQKLWRAGFKVVVFETELPLAIRRTVSLCSAVTEGKMNVEDLWAVRIEKIEECQSIWEKDAIPVIVDPDAQLLKKLKPMVVIDAILAKRNLGTTKEMAPIVIGLGPGFTANKDVDIVIETMRGHDLGRLIFSGSALPNTGVPGNLGGKSAERVVHSPASGKVKHKKEIGDYVQKGELLFEVDSTPVYSPLDGILRGLIDDKIIISKGLKCADVDPRSADVVNYATISDKSRALGGAVLEAILYMVRKEQVVLKF